MAPLTRTYEAQEASMTTTLSTDFAQALATALNLKARATEYVPADNPLNGMDADTIAGTSDFPASDMATKSALGLDMEAGRLEARAKHKDRTVAKRVAQHRERAQRKLEFDDLADFGPNPDPERMQQAWLVVAPLVPIVSRIAAGKHQWASRYLGSVDGDVEQVVLERMAIILAKSDRDLDLLERAALDLGEQAERDGIPRDQMSREDKAERKALAKARKWLMGMIHNRVQGTLCDLYTKARNLRGDDISIIETTMASIAGGDVDPLFNAHKAARAPGFLGTRFQAPDGIDQGLIAQAINAAVTDRGLDLIVEILLNQDNRRSDGSVAWSRIAESLFMATPASYANGAWMWDLVVKATEHHTKPERGRADAARTHIRNLFEWLPGFIVAVVEAFDPSVSGWAQQPVTRVHAAPNADHTVVRKVDVRFITGTSVVAAPNRNFDGTADEEGNVWPTTGGLPVGDAVAAEFRDVEVASLPWTFRSQEDPRPSWRAEAVLASTFDSYLDDQPGPRLLLQPALTYSSVEEAVEALTRHLDVLTGSDFLKGIAHA